jgi:hypothetical protein
VVVGRSNDMMEVTICTSKGGVRGHLGVLRLLAVSIQCDVLWSNLIPEINNLTSIKNDMRAIISISLMFLFAHFKAFFCPAMPLDALTRQPRTKHSCR